MPKAGPACMTSGLRCVVAVCVIALFFKHIKQFNAKIIAPAGLFLSRIHNSQTMSVLFMFLSVFFGFHTTINQLSVFLFLFYFFNYHFFSLYFANDLIIIIIIVTTKLDLPRTFITIVSRSRSSHRLTAFCS